MDNSLQAEHFDNIANQYPVAKILNQPYYTVLEVEKIITQVQNLNPGKSMIIDFGAGSGRVTIALLQRKFHVVAIDISTASLISLQTAAKKLALKNLTTTTSLRGQKNISAVVGADILHHVNLDEYLPQFYTVLKKDCIIAFSEPGGFNLAWYVFLPLFHSWKIEKGVTTMTPGNIRNKLKLYQFSDINIVGFGIIPPPFIMWSKFLCRINDKLGNVPFFKLFAYRYLIVARK